ncbi:MAG: hypothetical protein DI585_02900 [Pseudomonas fluorescens]|nr:MAG: hypothetical protein DI585_02900 [Pseudomonas fluorescens]
MSTHTKTFPPLFARKPLKSHTLCDYNVAFPLTDDQLAAVLSVMLQPFGSFFRKEQVEVGYNRTFTSRPVGVIPFGIIVRRYERLNVAIHTWDDDGKIMPLLLIQLYGGGIDIRVIEHYHFDGVLETTGVQGRLSWSICKNMLDKAEEYMKSLRPHLSWRLKKVAEGA